MEVCDLILRRECLCRVIAHPLSHIHGISEFRHCPQHIWCLLPLSLALPEVDHQQVQIEDLSYDGLVVHRHQSHPVVLSWSWHHNNSSTPTSAICMRQFGRESESEAWKQPCKLQMTLLFLLLLVRVLLANVFLNSYVLHTDKVVWDHSQTKRGLDNT